MAGPAPGDEEIAWAEEEQVELGDLRPEDGIVLVVFWALAVVVFLQFFTRYVLNSSLGWTEEIARYLLIGVTFIGAAMAVRKRSHIAVEFFYGPFGPAGRHRLALAVDLVSLLFYAAATWITVRLAWRTRQYMAVVDLPKSLIYWAVALGLLGMSIYAALNLARRWRSPPSDDDVPHGRLID
jgi:TRAP-type C4-dicarboxylate transport system permease small subunit